MAHYAITRNSDIFRTHPLKLPRDWLRAAVHIQAASKHEKTVVRHHAMLFNTAGEKTSVRHHAMLLNASAEKSLLCAWQRAMVLNANAGPVVLCANMTTCYAAQCCSPRRKLLCAATQFISMLLHDQNVHAAMLLNAAAGQRLLCTTWQLCSLLLHSAILGSI